MVASRLRCIDIILMFAIDPRVEELRLSFEGTYNAAHEGLIARSAQEVESTFSKLLQKTDLDEVVSQWSLITLEDHSVKLPINPSGVFSQVIFSICNTVFDAGGYLLTSVIYFLHSGTVLTPTHIRK